MADKLIAGAVAYREGKKGLVEWFLVKNAKDQLELPKTDVRRGESSVSAVLRYAKESAGLRPTVLDEAGRVTLTSSKNGEDIDEKLIFYLIQNKGQEPGLFIEGTWLKYPLAKKKLTLVREQKMLSQANDAVKQWTQKKKVKKVK
jgi:ADP-ribose pyrophosphatase YjhB (NUDIX family)